MPQGRPGGQLRHVNVAHYDEDKAAGRTKFVKLDGKVYFDKKEYHRRTGEEVTNLPLFPVDREQLVKIKEGADSLSAQAQNAIDDFDAL